MKTYADAFANLVSDGRELTKSRIPCRLVLGPGLEVRVDSTLEFGPTTHSAGSVEVCFYTAATGDEAIAVALLGTAADGDTVIITIDKSWEPIETVPRGKRVELFLPSGEKGNGEIAVGMICTDPGEPIDHYWTWGGPNSGMDIDYVPTHWRALRPGPDGLAYD